MSVFTVKPFSTKSGCFAPTLYVDADRREAKKDKSLVPNAARELSGLGRFESWDFVSNVSELRTRKKRR